MDGISLSIIGLFVALHGAAIWYKPGRLEQKLEKQHNVASL